MVNVVNLQNKKLNMRAEGEREFGVNRYIDIIPPQIQPLKMQILKKEKFFYASIKRLAVLLLAIGLNATGLFFAAENVLAYFNDDEKSTDNLIIAGAIDFILIDGEWAPIGSNLTLGAEDNTSRTVTVSDTAPSFSNPFNYTVHIEKTSGDDDFCELLLLDASMEGVPDYSGSLLGFLSGQYVFDPSGTDEWEFVVSVPSGAEGIDGKECRFDFIYDGWQVNLASYPSGFHDTEKVSNIVRGFESKTCEALSIGYWRNHEGCSGGEGSSIWRTEINDLSSEFSGLFSSYTGEAICENLWVPNCPSGNSIESKLCKAKAHTLADELNTVAGRLHLDALLGGADDGSAAFDNLGLNSGSSLNESLDIIEDILSNASSTASQITDADYVAERIYAFYEDENLDAPMCLMAKGSIVINEFLPNPVGSDNAPMPDGEWVELYNLSGTSIDVEGWHLYDNLDTHPLVISSLNSDNDGDTGDSGETIVPAGGYLLTYLNGAYSPGWLNNSGDTVRLYNGPAATSTLVDWYEYASDAPENKSFARIPDGTGDFVDPIPTPLKPNKLTEADESVVLQDGSISSSSSPVAESRSSYEQSNSEVTDTNSTTSVLDTEEIFETESSSRATSTEDLNEEPSATTTDDSDLVTDTDLITELTDNPATSTDTVDEETAEGDTGASNDAQNPSNESGSEPESEEEPSEEPIEDHSKDSKPEGIDDVADEILNNNSDGNGNENDDTVSDLPDDENGNSNSSTEPTEPFEEDAQTNNIAEISSGTSESPAINNENETINEDGSGESSDNLN